MRLSIRGTLRFLLLLSATVWLWWFFRSYFLFMAMLLMVGSAAASVLLFWKNKDGLCAEVLMPADRVGRGRAFPFEIQIKNKSRFVGFGAQLTYRWGNVFTQSYQTKQERVWIAPRNGVCVKQRMESVYAGRIEVEIERFVVYDALHILTFSGCRKSGAGTLVYPERHIGGEDALPAVIEGFPEDEETKKRGTDYNPDYEVREYIAGDELKSIHWKLTAKRERLMVRERLATGREKINVLLPLRSDKAENDRLMDAFCGVCSLLLEKGYPVQIFWMGTGEELRTGFFLEQGELEGAAAEILSASGFKQPEAVTQQMRILHPGESYVLIQTGAYQGAYNRQ
ncbi:MAG: DUF58 domain-containing protein [bacterium]|nr:DUF58 domain-containing protein [bacterium]